LKFRIISNGRYAYLCFSHAFFFLSLESFSRLTYQTSGFGICAAAGRAACLALDPLDLDFFLFKTVAGELANMPVSWDEFPLLPVPPVEQFWFLWALFLIQMAVLCARPLLSRERSATMGWMV
jgi:hypothetical protein